MTEYEDEYGEVIEEIDAHQKAYAEAQKSEDGVAALRMYAGHFYPRDWNYSRSRAGIKRIQYETDLNLWGRFKDACGWLIGKHDNLVTWGYPTGIFQLWKGRWHMFTYVLKVETNLPDGTLDDGKIITFWEEDGEYLNLMQPTVGLLVADLLDADPNDTADVTAKQKAVRDELNRLQTNYASRLEADRAKYCDREDCEKHGKGEHE